MADSQNNNSRKRAKTESEAGHFMDYKENKLYLLHSTGASQSQKFNKKFWRKAIPNVLKITSSARRVVWRAQDPRRRCKQTTEL